MTGANWRRRKARCPGSDVAPGHMKRHSTALTSPAPRPDSGPCPGGTSKLKISDQNPGFWLFLRTWKISGVRSLAIINISGIHVPPLGHGDSDSAGVHRELGSTKQTHIPVKMCPYENVFMAAPVITAQSGNNPRVHQLVNGETKHDRHTLKSITQPQCRMKFRHMLCWGRTLKTTCWGKEDRRKT